MYDVEDWCVLEEFPDYSVSTLGEIMNNDTRRIIKTSRTPRGSVKVGLAKERTQYTRMVKLLVAKTFVYGETEIFDTPINLDGDQSNNRVDNLAWRPRWFALNYTRQFKVHNKLPDGRVLDIDTGEIYDSIVSASIENGLLFESVLNGCVTGERVFPTWQKFSLIQ